MDKKKDKKDKKDKGPVIVTREEMEADYREVQRAKIFVDGKEIKRARIFVKTNEKTEKCDYCNGDGSVTHPFFKKIRKECPICKGTGIRRK